MLKAKFVECLLLQDFEYFERHGSGVLQARLNGDVEQGIDLFNIAVEAMLNRSMPWPPGRLAAWPPGRLAAWPPGRLAAWPPGSALISNRLRRIC